MATHKKLVDTLWNIISKIGAMDKLISGRAQLEVSKKVEDILLTCALMIVRPCVIYNNRTLQSISIRISRPGFITYSTIWVYLLSLSDCAWSVCVLS